MANRGEAAKKAGVQIRRSGLRQEIGRAESEIKEFAGLGECGVRLQRTRLMSVEILRWSVVPRPRTHTYMSKFPVLTFLPSCISSS